MFATNEQRTGGALRAAFPKAALLLLLAAAMPAQAGLVVQDLSYNTSRALFKNGASAGFSAADTVGITAAGVSYDISANTGTVTSNVRGRLNVSHDDSVRLGSSANVQLSYAGARSTLASNFGAGATVTGYINACVVPNIFTGGCVTRVNPTFDLIDEGVRLRPDSAYTSRIGGKGTVSATDEAAGVGSVDLIIGKVGPEVALDISQTASLSLNGITGTMQGRHRGTGATFTESFSLGATGLSMSTPELSLAGIWDFDILDLGLSNTFSNLMTLDLRPNINYLVGSWPNEPLAKITLLNETFSLGFGAQSFSNLFSLNVFDDPIVAVPEPEAAGLMLLGLMALLFGRSRGMRRR